MSQYTEENVKAFTAAEALAAFRRVKLDSSADIVYADARDDCVGSTEAAIANTATATSFESNASFASTPSLL